VQHRVSFNKYLTQCVHLITEQDMYVSVFTKLHISKVCAENVNVQSLPTLIETGSYFIIFGYLKKI